MTSVQIVVYNKCRRTLRVHIGMGDGGRIIPRGGNSIGYCGRSDRVWADTDGSGSGNDSLVEIDDENGHVFYNLSIVDGFTLPIQVRPVGGGPPSNPRTFTCRGGKNILKRCPESHKLRDGRGKVVGCRNHSDPAVQYMFKRYCPQAYCWDDDDKTSIVVGDITNPQRLAVTFCP